MTTDTGVMCPTKVEIGKKMRGKDVPTIVAADWRGIGRDVYSVRLSAQERADALEDCDMFFDMAIGLGTARWRGTMALLVGWASEARGLVVLSDHNQKTSGPLTRRW